MSRKLEQLNLEVHLVDLRNHGKSFHESYWSLASLSMNIFLVLK